MFDKSKIPINVDFSAVDLANQFYPNSIRYDTEGRLCNKATPTVTRLLRKTRGVLEVQGKHLIFWYERL